MLFKSFKKTILLSALVLTSCNANMNAAHEEKSLEPLKQTERLDDFNALVNLFKSHYGPLKYKEKMFNFKFDDLVESTRKDILNAKDDAENFGVLQKFITQFQDGHVGISAGVGAGERNDLAFSIATAGDQMYVSEVADPNFKETHNIEIGDEVVSIDGMNKKQFIKIISQYESLGNTLSDEHLIALATKRPAYITELKPQRPTAQVVFKKASGDVYERSFVWKNVKNSLEVASKFPLNKNDTAPVMSKTRLNVTNSALMNLKLMGKENPFFINEKTIDQFGFAPISASVAILKKNGFKDEDHDIPDMQGFIYKYEGKNILLVRIATYGSSDYESRLIWLKSVLEQYQNITDALVIDQTNNPGGYLTYAAQFASLFAQNQTRGLVNFLRPDRKWLNDFAWTSKILDMRKSFDADKPRTNYTELKAQNDLAYAIVEDALNKRLPLTSVPVPLEAASEYLQRPGTFKFTKPVLMLINELAGSCGDVVPLLMKENKIATLFGNRTMGLGGNVETVGTLPHSQIDLRLTRGHFAVYRPDGKYDLNHLTENNGVEPDIKHDLTLKDIREDYKEYINAFSKAAISLIKTK